MKTRFVFAFVATFFCSSIALAWETRPISMADFLAQSGEGFDLNYFDYDILLEAAATAGLVDALADGNADLTLFAPNDLAFVRLARDLGYEGFSESGAWDFLVAALTELGDGDPIPVLTDVLLYHVSPSNVDAIDFIIAGLFRIPIETLLEDASIQPQFLSIIDNEPDLRNARLFFPLNVATGNGIVHTINRVLIPVDLP